MLVSLRIENFAIVEQLELCLQQGLTIISGETGAGKSILIDALGLVLGERADSTVVRQHCEFAQVEAEFILSPAAIQWLHQQHWQLGNDRRCYVRRLLHTNGRSRGYINDHPASVQMLRELSEFLVDIHGQHAHQSLLKSETQRQLLDAALEDEQVLTQVAQAYDQWRTLQTELDNLGGAAKDREMRLTLLRYQVQELEGLELTVEAITRLEEEHRRLANVNKLLENSQQALSLLDADDSLSTLSYLTQARHQLREVQQHDNRLCNITTLLENAIIQTQEAVGELRHYLHHLDIDPARLQSVEQRITTLQDMARKHKIRLHDLPAYFSKLTAQLDELENYEQHANRLEAEVATASTNYRLAAETLHEQRLKAAPVLAEQIVTQMQPLGMPDAQLAISVIADEEAAPTPTGMDSVEFLVTTNPGQPLRPLSKVASGGELSRISLAIQVIAAQSSGVPTLVFDEVDVGIGGRIAEIVGQLLKRLGQQRQVLCITHLPQVACQGQQHLQVSKVSNKQTTQAYITVLEGSQRVEEIARMLGGIEMTAPTLAHAQEMLRHGHQVSGSVSKY